MIAGLVGGPWAGLLVGLIGGLHRFYLGWNGMADWSGYGFTCIPCSVSTVLVGLLAGLVRKRWGLLKIPQAFLVAALLESLHMLLGTLFGGNPAQWLTAGSILTNWGAVTSKATVPMVIANSLGVGIFFFALHNYLGELRAFQDRDKYYAQVEKRNTELQMVHLVSQDITASLDLDQTLQTVLERVRQMIDFDGAEVTLYNKNENNLAVRAWQGSDRLHLDTRGHTYPMGKGYTGWIAENRRSLRVDDVNAHQAQRPLRTQLDDGLVVTSYLGVPLTTGQELVGTMELVSTHISAFDEHEQKLLETIAPQAAIAILNARQVMERERILKEQIKALQIQLDEAKRDREVAQIEETEFFQDLKEKAKSLRKKSR
jgi:LytS/YehU family sensor histidine kinase